MGLKICHGDYVFVLYDDEFVMRVHEIDAQHPEVHVLTNCYGEIVGLEIYNITKDNLDTVQAAEDVPSHLKEALVDWVTKNKGELL